MFRVLMFYGYLELCAHTNRFVFPLVCNYTKQLEKARQRASK